MRPSEEWQKWEPHGSEPDHKDPWKDFQDADPQKQWQNFDRMQGRWRIEFLVPLPHIVRVINGLFRRKI